MRLNSSFLAVRGTEHPSAPPDSAPQDDALREPFLEPAPVDFPMFFTLGTNKIKKNAVSRLALLVMVMVMVMVMALVRCKRCDCGYDTGFEPNVQMTIQWRGHAVKPQPVP